MPLRKKAVFKRAMPTPDVTKCKENEPEVMANDYTLTTTGNIPVQIDTKGSFLDKKQA